MRLNDISKPLSAAQLNENLALKFGQRIKLEDFTREHLENVRNKLRTTLSQIETNESFDSVNKEEYQKNKLFLDVLNAAIKEREETETDESMKFHRKHKFGKAKKKFRMRDDTNMNEAYIKSVSDAIDIMGALRRMGKSMERGQNLENAGTFANLVVNDLWDVMQWLEARASKLESFATRLAKKKFRMRDDTNMNEAYIKSVSDAIDIMGALRRMGKSMERGQNLENAGTFANLVVNDLWDVMQWLEARASKLESFAESRKLREGEEDKAEIIMAAKDMVDRLTGWMEDTAEMRTESMLELADAIRDELGSAQSESFQGQVEPALDSLYRSMEETRSVLINGVGLLTGEGDDMEMMGAEDPMEPTVDDELGGDEMGDDDLGMDGGDDFAASGAADGGEELAGRPKRESRDYSAKKAAAGKDIGKKGKNFSKIAKKSGGGEKGNRIAGAVLKKLRAKESREMVESSRRLAGIMSAPKKN